MELKNDLMRRDSIYSFYWFSADSRVDLDSNFYDFEGWSDEEPLPLCLFPGLSESIRFSDGSIKELCIVPASVTLE